MQNDSSWQPSASIETLKIRAQILAKIRDFFQQRKYLEVETPILSHFGVTDVYLENIQATFRNKPYSLQTSPEYAMKRLLAAGSGPIFQIARVFRDDEWGRWHNPEFTMLEWYRLGIDHHALMDEMEDFLLLFFQEAKRLERYTYQALFQKVCDIDPFNTSILQLKNVLKNYQLEQVLPEDEQDPDQYLFLLMSEVIEPYLAEYKKNPIAIYDFPASQASLAKINHLGFAERFEIYYKGVELANGFHELTDYQAQKNRFESDVAIRKQKNLPQPSIDIHLLKALESGLPACSGVALGIDRLIALALGSNEIAKVLAFDFSRA